MQSEPPYVSPLGPRAKHGTWASYSRGCRCQTHHGLFKPPQTTGCREAWREYRRDKERERAHRKKLAAAYALIEAEESRARAE